KVTEFNQTVVDNGFLSPQILDEELENLDWQKYKMTEDNGTTPLMSDFDFNSPEAVLNYSAGTYYVSGAWNSTANNIASNYGYLSINTTYSTKSVATLTFIPIGTNTLNNTSIYMRKKNGDWGDWKEITNNQSDTGWITFDLINGAKTNTAYTTEENPGFKCAYRIIKNNTETKRIVRINGTNLTHNQVIAQLPETFVKNAQAFPVRVPANDYTGYVVFKVSGEVTFIISGDRSLWIEDSYAYGECSWTD